MAVEHTHKGHRSRLRLRAEQEGYLEPSFATISAYGPHAAMCHYSSSPATNVPIEPKGL